MRATTGAEVGGGPAARPTALLSGLQVLDLSLWQPGHTATQLLADLGADVIKVEPPGGDRMRPLADRFANFNGGKRSVVLNLKDSHQRDLFLGLVRRAEVVVENYRPGVAERLGVGFEVLRVTNPGIVLCSISGFGQTGPLAGETGHDANFQAYAGAFTVRDGTEPVPSALLVGDQGSGMAAAFAILAAVLCARRTGQAEHIDVSMADLLASWVAPMGALDDRRGASDPPGAAPAMGSFRTADGRWIVLGVFSEDHFWTGLCEVLGLDRLAALSMPERSAGAVELRAEITVAVAGRERDELLRTLSGRSVPAAPVLTRAEMLEHPHFRHRGVVTEAPDGSRALGHPIRYSVHPSSPPRRAPMLDEHRHEVIPDETVTPSVPPGA